MIVYGNSHGSDDEGGYLKQGIIGVSNRLEPFTALYVQYTALCACNLTTNDTKLNLDGFKEIIFVIVTNHCATLKEEGGLVGCSI